MKLKTGFVTNSSAASFILTVESELDLEEFTEKFNDFISWFNEHLDLLGFKERVRYWNANNIFEVQKIYKNKVKGGSKKKYNITESVSMFNFDYEIPDYMKFLCMDKIIRKRQLNFNFEVVNFEIDSNS